MAIPVQDARGVFTRQIVARWNELSEIAPKNFLRSLFGKTTTDSKEVSIEVMRGSEKVAVDVLRGSGGNRNTFSKSSEKTFVPPFFDEYFDMTEIDKYDLIFGQAAMQVTEQTVTSVIAAALEKTNILRNKIERRYELQASQVLTTGIVELVSGDNIDFKRKAASMVLNSPAEYWKVSTVDPRVQLRAGADFLRATGKATDGLFKVILGANALSDLFSNPFIVNEKVKDISLIDLKMPEADAMGGVYHGRISAGPYKFDLWSYPEVYDDPDTGVSTHYIDENYMIMVPNTSGKFIFAFAGVPMIVQDLANAQFPQFITQVATDYALYNHLDTYKKAHLFGVMSAGVPIPVSVDRIYSRKVTGTEVVGG